MVSVRLQLPGPGQLDEVRRRACQALGERIAGRIEAAGGAIGFEVFMEAALYEPDLGYYMRDAAIIGAGGDFVTAPESCPLFSRALAAPVAEVLDALGGGVIMEAGAGSGAMARDLLGALAEAGSLPEEYRIIERSPALAGRQRDTLAVLPLELRQRLCWIDAPRPMRGVVLANELFDALAVQRFVVRGGRALPLQVGLDGGRFCWREGAADAGLDAWYAALVTEIGTPLAEGYRSERCPGLAAMLSRLCAPLEAGLALFLDYGYPRREYYHPQRVDGTLLCHFEHRAHAEPLLLPGLQDITASVDFTALARAGEAAGLQPCGFTSQTWFLMGCGFESLLAAAMQAAGHGSPAALALAGAARRLLLPGEMGERVQVLGLARGLPAAPRAFALRDQRGRLEL